MLCKTKGLVFRYVKYRETSIIVTLFTELLGIQNCIVNGVYGGEKSKNKIALYQPLTWLEMEIYHRDRASITRIREAHCFYPYQTLLVDPIKLSIGFFLIEMLNRSIRQQTHHQDICNFLFTALCQLDQMQAGVENFHLLFLLRLAGHLGFLPNAIGDVVQPGELTQTECNYLSQLLVAQWGIQLPMNRTERNRLLQAILRFYDRHIDRLGKIRSLPVLEAIMK